MKTFRDEMNLRPPSEGPEAGQEMGLFRNNDERLKVYRMLQQRLYERKQRSAEMQAKNREE